ncbi:MAG: long-chain fatty acid--CoA ligase [Candidatus Marinimicrobia bacterium]|nr:long-chain fatty acid--CoA ligase [Candidatus Neomarinimicrobiota bacterium]
MFQSLPHLLQNSIRQYSDKAALLYKRDGELRSYTYREFGEAIHIVADGLADIGVQTGDKIAILSNNRPEWTIVDFACYTLKAVVVPIYQTLPPNQIAYILKDSETRAIFVEDQTQFDKIVEIESELPDLQFIFSFNPIETPHEKLTEYSQIVEKGKNHRQANPDFFKTSMDSIKTDDVCSIVYTSGTTGEPKGVMLHHRGFITEIISSETTLNVYSTDIFLSFLPLSHLYERVAGHYTAMYRGATIFYSQSINTVIDDLAEARPTMVVSVPRLFEKIARKVMDEVESSPAYKQKIFNWAVNTGRKYRDQKIEGKISHWMKDRYRIANFLVFKKIKQKLGGRMRCPIAGGAPLSIQTLKFFEALDMPIIEGYGMTETHLILTLTPFGKTRYGSCGRVINEVQMKIANDGEILVKGQTLMAGYYKKPEMTRDVIDSEGWLHTGDIGHLDEDNFLYITDRKKNILVTSGGKNVASAPIENVLKTSRFIEDVCLIGDRRKFVSAIIIPNFETLRKWATEHRIHVDSDKELVEHPSVYNLIWMEIETLQRDFARYEKVKKFLLIPEPLSIDKGEMTPSLKIKRSILEDKYKEQIDQLYNEESVVKS